MKSKELKLVAETNDVQIAKEALGYLRSSAKIDSENPLTFYQLAIAYGRLNEIGMAELSTAQYYAATGEIKDARMHAAKAQRMLKTGSPEWLRAQDIATAHDPMDERDEFDVSRSCFRRAGGCSVWSPVRMRRLPRVSMPRKRARSRRSFTTICSRSPEILVEVMTELDAKQASEEASRADAAVAENKKAIYEDPSSFVAGNPKGDVTIVEFFDYHCGYANALSDH